MGIKFEDITADDEPDQALVVVEPSIVIVPPSAASSMLVPRLIVDAGEDAALRFLDFFTANIRNPNTRAAYAVAVRALFVWLDEKQVAPLAAVRTHHVSAYVELLTRAYRAPTVKQHLAAIRMLFDWLIVGQIVPTNPAAAVRGPKHVVKKGKTPVLDGDEAKKLIDSIDVSTIVGLRDRALIALLVYSFARVSAALAMSVEDYYPQGKRWWLRLHEKGGKQHEMPAHHLLEHYLDAYLGALRQAEGGELEKGAPLFRTLGGRGRKILTAARMARQDARRMIVRRAVAAGIITRLGCHTFRATGITVYLLNGGLLEYAQQMAAHESARTTKLYDRRNDQITLDQVERIVL
jgi:site-specific recombinase XerD